MTSKLHTALLAGSAAIVFAIGTLSVQADSGKALRAAQQPPAALDAATDADEIASTSRAVSGTATSALDDAGASEILDVLMAAIGAATEE